MTLILLAGIGITLSVAGGDPVTPRDGAPLGAAVAGAEGGPEGSAPQRVAIESRVGRTGLWQAVAHAGPDGEDVAEPLTVGAPSPVESSPALFRVTAGRVNLRAGPSTANQVLDQVVRDQHVELLDSTDSGWARIHVPETGLTAWIFDSFLAPAG